MPVFFGRDISRFSEFISVWYGDSPKLRIPDSVSPKFKLLFPLDYLPTVNNAQTQLLVSFVEGLEKALDVERTEISLADKWKADIADGPENDDLAEYLKLVGRRCRPPFMGLTAKSRHRPVATLTTTMRIMHYSHFAESTRRSSTSIPSSIGPCSGSGEWNPAHSSTAQAKPSTKVVA